MAFEKCRCKDCECYSPGAPSKPDAGECRLNPPRVLIFPGPQGSTAHAGTYWPTVKPDTFWCGQWKRRK